MSEEIFSKFSICAASATAVKLIAPSASSERVIFNFEESSPLATPSTLTSAEKSISDVETSYASFFSSMAADATFIPSTAFSLPLMEMEPLRFSGISAASIFLIISAVNFDWSILSLLKSES